MRKEDFKFFVRHVISHLWAIYIIVRMYIGTGDERLGNGLIIERSVQSRLEWTRHRKNSYIFMRSDKDFLSTQIGRKFIFY